MERLRHLCLKWLKRLWKALMAKKPDTYPRVHCGECRYRDTVDFTCRRNPPQPGSIDSAAQGVKIGYPIWAKVEDKNWCGEGKTLDGLTNA